MADEGLPQRGEEGDVEFELEVTLDPLFSGAEVTSIKDQRLPESKARDDTDLHRPEGLVAGAVDAQSLDDGDAVLLKSEVDGRVRNELEGDDVVPGTDVSRNTGDDGCGQWGLAKGVIVFSRFCHVCCGWRFLNECRTHRMPGDRGKDVSLSTVRGSVN